MVKQFLQPDPDKLRAARLAKKYSMQMLANKTGVSTRTLYMIEYGMSRPFADQVIAWALACEVKMTDLFTLAPPKAFIRKRISAK